MCTCPGENARSWEALGGARPGQSSLSAGALGYRAWAHSSHLFPAYQGSVSHFLIPSLENCCFLHTCTHICTHMHMGKHACGSLNILWPCLSLGLE